MYIYIYIYIEREREIDIYITYFHSDLPALRNLIIWSVQWQEYALSLSLTTNLYVCSYC